MAYVEITQYIRGQRPTLEASNRDYIDREFQKIEATLRTISAAIKELREKKRDL